MFCPNNDESAGYKAGTEATVGNAGFCAGSGVGASDDILESRRTLSADADAASSDFEHNPKA